MAKIFLNKYKTLGGKESNLHFYRVFLLITINSFNNFFYHIFLFDSSLTKQFKPGSLK